MYEHSDSIKHIAAALAKVQAALRPAIKDSVNPHFKSRYADLGNVWEACRQPLAENGLSVAQMPVGNEIGRIGLTTMLMHESGEWLANTVYVRLAKDDPQGAGSGLTYLRRYSLAAMVGIVADEDDDGNAASTPQRQTQPQKPAAFNPEAARARIAAHPNVRDEDVQKAATLNDRESLLKLYKEIDERL
jgi:hypothetical protein